MGKKLKVNKPEINMVKGGVWLVCSETDDYTKRQLEQIKGKTLRAEGKLLYWDEAKGRIGLFLEEAKP